MRCRICADLGFSWETKIVSEAVEHLRDEHFKLSGAPRMPLEYINLTMLLYFGQAINARQLGALKRAIESALNKKQIIVNLDDKRKSEQVNKTETIDATVESVKA